jgi:hypothetical protein
MGNPTANFSNKEQDHIGYLNLIQGNIARMAGNSALMKGCAARMIAAMLGMAVSESAKWYYIAISLVPVLAFIRLDIFYLQRERRYRNLYNLVAENTYLDLKYTLDLRSDKLQEYKDTIYKNSSFIKTMCSVSVWQFYIWFVALAVALIIFIA